MKPLDAIPDYDPRFAFAQFERACRKSLLEAEKNEEDWAAVASFRQDYMHDVVAAAQHYGISELADYRIPLGEDYKQHHFDDFVRRDEGREMCESVLIFVNISA